MRNNLNDYLDFCVKVFWCRCDKAFINWIGFYLVAALIVYIGRELKILFGGDDIWSLLLTSLFVTIVTASISYRRKHMQRMDKMLQDDKKGEIDI